MVKKIVYLFLVIGNFSFSQNFIHTNQFWSQYYLQVRKQNFIVGFDTGLRLKSEFKDPFFFIARASLLYKISNTIALGGGLAFTENINNAGLVKIEMRPYQEIAFSKKINLAALTLRYRIEERFFQIYNYRNYIDGYFELRNRISIMLQRNFWEIKKTSVFFSLGNEIFFKNKGSDMMPVVEMNRFVFGPGLKSQNDFSFQLLYNLQLSDFTNESGNVTHVFWLTLRKNIQIKNH